MVESDAANSTSMRVLGVRVDVTNMTCASETIVKWAEKGGARTVFVRDTPSLMLASKLPVLKQMHERADLVVPDGMPLVWVGKARGHRKDIGRVAGADLLDRVCSASNGHPLRHYFFGGKPQVAERMIANLLQRYPRLSIAGCYSPPMRDLTPASPLAADELEEVEAIKATQPDVIWVGLSSPKQEYWIMRAIEHFPHGVFLGVGAAFDFHSGAVVRAPEWMRSNGLEWLHRLLSEPRRLWRRYLLLAPQFLVLVSLEHLSLLFRRRAIQK